VEGAQGGEVNCHLDVQLDTLNLATADGAG